MKEERVVEFRINEEKYFALAKDIGGVVGGKIVMRSNGVQVTLAVDKVLGVSDIKSGEKGPEEPSIVFRIWRKESNLAKDVMEGKI